MSEVSCEPTRRLGIRLSNVAIHLGLSGMSEAGNYIVGGESQVHRSEMRIRIGHVLDLFCVEHHSTMSAPR